MLRTKAGRSSALRLLDDRDINEVLALCDRDPVVNVFVSSRVHDAGLVNATCRALPNPSPQA